MEVQTEVAPDFSGEVKDRVGDGVVAANSWSSL